MIKSTIVMAASVRQDDERARLPQRLVDRANELVASGRGGGERARDGLAVRHEGNPIAGEADDLQIVRSARSLVFQGDGHRPWVDGDGRWLEPVPVVNDNRDALLTVDDRCRLRSGVGPTLDSV